MQAQAAAVFAEVEEHIVKLRRAVVGHGLRKDGLTIGVERKSHPFQLERVATGSKPRRGGTSATARDVW